MSARHLSRLGFGFWGITLGLKLISLSSLDFKKKYSTSFVGEHQLRLGHACLDMGYQDRLIGKDLSFSSCKRSSSLPCTTLVTKVSKMGSVNEEG
ncbi:hypothetical protein SLEP1_g42423 [Rubroshorea leprosula]|uniref:Uncharacterized protein n=1 Tax=Rubroshorea leprosula TaxID=152421 RepID=A0AAV5LA08_9ROSI|nr:hypothetical protein SLEP1_g42423 [Rubroshorea leprosula]